MADDAHLLPPNASNAERGISSAAGKRVSAVPAPLRDLWRPETCPTTHLPWLAWAVSVDDWSAAWPEATKRQVIAEAIAVQRRKGTPWAVKRSLEQMGFNRVEIIEETNIRYDGSLSYDGSETYGNGLGPYRFSVLLNVADSIYAGDGATGELTAAVIAEVNRRIDAAKNERSKLADLYAYSLYYDGAETYDGSNTYSGGIV